MKNLEDENRLLKEKLELSDSCLLTALKGNVELIRENRELRAALKEAKNERSD